MKLRRLALTFFFSGALCNVLTAQTSCRQQIVLTVTDAQGELVAQLRAPDLQVTQGRSHGIVRELTRSTESLEVLLVLDTGESMFDPPEKWQTALKAIRQLIDMPEVNGKVRIWIHPTGEKFETADRTTVATTLDILTQRGEQHGAFRQDLSDSIVRALNSVAPTKHAAVLIVTDGTGRFDRQREAELAIRAFSGRFFAFFPNISSPFRMEAVKEEWTGGAGPMTQSASRRPVIRRYKSRLAAQNLLAAIGATGGDSFAVFDWLAEVNDDAIVREKSTLQGPRIPRGLNNLYAEILHPYVAVLELPEGQHDAVKIRMLSPAGARLTAHYPAKTEGCGAAPR